MSDRFEVIECEDDKLALVDNDTLDSFTPVKSENEIALQLAREASAHLDGIEVASGELTPFARELLERAQAEAEKLLDWLLTNVS